MVLVGSLVGCGSEGAPTVDASPDVVVILVDTLRADRLGCYGYGLPTSPEIDALADTATLFEHHTSQANSTSPSILSILTGTYPSNHRNYFAVPLEGTFEDRTDIFNLAERLAEANYSSHAVWSHPLWRARTGGNAFDRGWETYATLPQDREYLDRIELGDAARVTDRAIGVLDAWEDELGARPLLLLAHYFDPHMPYWPPAEDRDRFLSAHLERVGLSQFEDELRGRTFDPSEQTRGDRTRAFRALGDSRYDEEVRDMSRQVGRLLDDLRRRGLFDDALVVFLADHGENLDDMGRGRGRGTYTHKGLFDAVIGTPLIVKLPGQRKPSRIAGLSQNIDVLPTILELLGLEEDPSIDGASLLPLIAGEVDEIHQRVFAESADQLAKTVRTPELKLIQQTPESEPMLFDWRADRHELVDVASTTPRHRLLELAGALVEFRPECWLRLDLSPAAVPDSVRARFELTSGLVLETEGDGWTVSDDRTVATWAGTVDGEGREPALRLSRSLPGMEFSVASDGPGPLLDRLYLGATPLVESYVFEAGPGADGAAVDEPRPVTVVTRDDGRAIQVDYAFDEPRSLEVEVAHTTMLAGRSLTLDAGGADVAFEPLQPLPRARHAGRWRGTGARAGRLLIASEGNPELLRWRIAVDGRWPARDRLAVDGRAPTADSLRFVWDEPADGAVRAGLAAAATGQHPPGSITLRYEQSGAMSASDIGLLSEDVVDELRALGYVK